MSNKKMTVPDIGGLLGQIAAKRPDMPKTAIQRVQPIEEEKQEIFKEENNLSGKTLKSESSKEDKKKMGRKSKKLEGVVYVKISPQIPKPLKKQVDVALKAEHILDDNGVVIGTLDECVEYALKKLLMK